MTSLTKQYGMLPKLDSEPLLEAARRQVRASQEQAVPVTDMDISDLLGVSRKRVMMWRQGREVNWVDADALAVRLGVHPVELWPEWTAGG